VTYSPTRGPEAKTGSGGVYTATFKAVRNGRATLTMEYKQPGEKNIKNIKKFTLTIAVGAHNALSPKAAKLARLVKADVASFTLNILYFGPQDKPYYELTLRVPVVKDKRSAFQPAAQLTANAARKVIDHLAADGFFDRATDIREATVIKPKRPVMPKGPAYTLSVSGAKGRWFSEPIGWDLKMLARLDALAMVLDADGARKMTLLLGRLSGLRKQWQAKVKPASTKRKRIARLRGVTAP